MIRNAVRVGVVALVGAGLLAVAAPAQATHECTVPFGTWCLVEKIQIS